MGACTFTADADAFSPGDGNKGWEVRGTLFLSNSVASGGDTVAPGIFGLGELHKLNLDAGAGYVASPVVASGVVTKVQAWYTGTASDDPFNEAVGVDLSAVGFRCVATGF